ncbi:MAG TPA: hypothetical protein VF459_02050 [Caulobacteraceae bacterium]
MSGPCRRAGGVVLALMLTAAATAAMGSTVGGRTFSAPSVVPVEGGVRVHGSVCRTSTVTPMTLSGVRIEWVDDAGHVVEAKVARMSRDLTGRQVGCAFYDQKTDWSLNLGDRIRVCAAGGGDCPAG